MRSYRPASYSQQARKLCDKQILYIKSGLTTIEEAEEILFNTYRSPLVKQRAIKRFGRKIRKGV